ncbi:MAG: pyrimidine reductase family protein [Pseudonocardiaceae bacterium]
MNRPWIESLWPLPTADALSDEEIADIYAYPNPLSTKACWIRANFVESLDGASALGGRSEPLSSPADKRVFRLLRALADVILVGAGTVRAEGYGWTQLDVAEYSALRHSQKPVPPIAVVTRFGDLDPAADLFSHNTVSPIVFTSKSAPQERLKAIEAVGAEIVLTGDRDVPLPRVFEELARRGLPRVLCEGGPQLFTSLLAENAVDELCLTLAPTLAGGSAPRISCGSTLPTVPVAMRLASVLFSYDSLLLRYLRR